MLNKHTSKFLSLGPFAIYSSFAVDLVLPVDLFKVYRFVTFRSVWYSLMLLKKVTFASDHTAGTYNLCNLHLARPLLVPIARSRRPGCPLRVCRVPPLVPRHPLVGVPSRDETRLDFDDHNAFETFVLLLALQGGKLLETCSYL